jgi:hypothetical protein
MFALRRAIGNMSASLKLKQDSCEKALARILVGSVVPFVGQGLEADPETDRIDEFDR